MKNVLESNEKKTPAVQIDKSLNKYSDVVLFPEKVEKARKTIERIGVPQKKSNS